MIINFYNVGGGGGGGTTNYNDLENKPQINNVILSGNVSSDQLGIVSDKLLPVSATPQTASAGTLYSVCNIQHVVKYEWDNVITPSHYSFIVNEKPAVDTKIGTFYDNDVEITIDVYTRDNNGYYIEFGSYLNVQEGQSGSTYYYGDAESDGFGVTIDYTNTGSVVFDFWYSSEGQIYENTDTVEMTYQASDEYDINEISLKQAIGEDASGSTVYRDIPTEAGMSAHWYNYTDGMFTLVREDCTNDGEYLCHFGADIGGSRSFRGVKCSGGTIDTTYEGYGMHHAGDGHMVGSVTDANGVTYWAHAWSQGGKLYWQINAPVEMLDAYGTGSNKEGGLIF